MSNKSDFNQRRKGRITGKRKRKDKTDRTSNSSVDLYIKTQFQMTGQACSRCALKHNSEQQQLATLGVAYMSKQPAACKGLNCTFIRHRDYMR